MPRGPLIVTGVAGFIGSHVAQALLARGQAVVGVDNFDPFYPRALKQANLDTLDRAQAQARSAAGGPSRFSFAQLDCADADAFARLCARCEPAGIVHLAAKAGVRPSMLDPAGYVRANIAGTQSVLDAARPGPGRDSGVPVIIASSSSVYGNAARVPFREDDPADAPISPYAATKRAAELLAHTHHALGHGPAACLRFFTVFGPRQRPDLAIRKFLAAAHRGEPIAMFGDGRTSRDYTYVDDIVAGVLAALERVERFGFRIWNLGHAHPVTLSGLLEAVGRTVGRAPIITPAPMQKGDVDRTCADLTRSRAELGYEPSTTLEEGLARQWSWMRSTDAGEPGAAAGPSVVLGPAPATSGHGSGA